MNLNKTTDYVLLKAVDKSEECVADKKIYETKTSKCGKEIYFVLDRNSKRLDFPRIADYLKRFSETSKKNLNVCLDSFVSFIKEAGQTFDMILTVVSSISFYEKPTFSLKTKKEPVYDINYLINEDHIDFFNEVAVIKEAQHFCRTLQDMPSNFLYPTEFTKRVKELFSDVKDKVNIVEFDKARIKQEKMNLLLAVNAGSIREPRFMYIEYKNNPESDEYYGYVGKGITFDAGGMNIKTANHMRWMKFDMSGAATVVSTLYALAKNNVKTNVVAVVCLTENLVSPTSVRPDDVIISHSGKTVEIDNTDAEGRLVLADGLSFAARNLKVTKLVDVATLTGAMLYALGDTYTGVWSTCTCQWKTFEEIAYKSGEYVWRLPLHEDFLKPLESNIADIANSVSDPRAGSSRAACFLKEFTNDLPYIHLDIAITADVKHIGHGTMVRTLYNYAKNQNFN